MTNQGVDIEWAMAFAIADTIPRKRPTRMQAAGGFPDG